MVRLVRKRTLESYFEKISNKSASTVKTTRTSLDGFESFCMRRHSCTMEQIIEELLSMDPDAREQAACDIYQAWVSHMHSEGRTTKTIQVYFSSIKNYMHYRGVKMSDAEIRDGVTFPRVISEERFPLEMRHITAILATATYRKKSLYLALLSSGMRIGEAVRIKKRDVRYVRDRLAVSIPARITKTGKGRTVFISLEAVSHIAPRLRNMSDDDLVWGTSSVNTESTVLRRYVEKLGYTDKYDSGTRKITLHSFRAFFFTRAARIHGENYAHMMTGHGGYLMQYDRLTDDEKLDMYIKLEPELFVYDQTRNEHEIRKLRDKNAHDTDRMSKIDEYERRIKHLEELVIKSNEKADG